MDANKSSLAVDAERAADSAEEALIGGDGAALTAAVELLQSSRSEARMAGLLPCWLRRETVEAVRAIAASGSLHHDEAAEALGLIARDLGSVMRGMV